MASDLVKQWLQTVLKPYPSRDRILTEVVDVLNQRRTLSVKTDAFTFDSGQTALLLLLHGTLPITFRGATYHIPVNVWVPLEYPRSPPMAFVVPTKEMGVRKGREVEPGGRVREEVVADWWKSWEHKSIDSLLRQLIVVFSESPPVYSRPTEPTSTAGAGPSTPTRPQNVRIASPQELNDSRPMSSSSSWSGNETAQPPPPPARPASILSQIHIQELPQYRSAPIPTHQSPSYPQSPQRQASAQYPAHLGQMQGQSSQPQSPPLPNRPPQIPSRQSSQPANGQMMHYSNPSEHQNGSQLQTPPRVEPPPRPALPYQYHGDPRTDLAPVIMSNGGGFIAGPSQVVSHQSPQPYPPYQQAPNGIPLSSSPYSQAPPPQLPSQPQLTPVEQQPSVHPRQPMPDLLSSPEASSIGLPTDSSPTTTTAPPPLPPSKPPPPSLLHLHSILLPHLSAALPPILHSLQQTHSHLLERREDLLSGEPAIRDEMARLEAVKKVCDSVGRRMEDVVRAGEERVSDLEGRGEVSVDEVVCGISIVHNQLIDLVAEDNAIEDTIYHLTRALDAERIDLDRFLKSIRSLAREQYMKRALIERILQGMGQTQGW